MRLMECVRLRVKDIDWGNDFMIYTHVLNKPGIMVRSPADLA